MHCKVLNAVAESYFFRSLIFFLFFFSVDEEDDITFRCYIVTVLFYFILFLMCLTGKIAMCVSAIQSKESI